MPLLIACSFGCIHWMRESLEGHKGHGILSSLSYSRLQRFRQQLLATQKWVTSLFKPSSKWQLEDYPVIIRHQDNSEFKGPSRLKPVEWVAHIVRWTVTGSGDSREEAVENLRAIVERKRREKGRLPRPGTKVPIEFTSQDQISQYSELEKDFVERVLRLDWAWMSDESSLWDFHEQEDNNEYYGRIILIYGVDVSDVPGARIAGILAKISESRS